MVETEKPVPGRAPAAAEPIAVIGMACRFPGAPDIPSFWRLLEAGGNAVTEGVPGSGVGRVGELLPESAAGNTACRFGAFVPDIDLFDNGFFPDLPGGSGVAGSAAAHDAGSQLAGPRGRGDRSPPG